RVCGSVARRSCRTSCRRRWRALLTEARCRHRVPSCQLSINAIVRVGLCYGFELGRRRCQLSINAIVRVGLCYGFELGRRRYIESLPSPVSRRGRKPAINNVVHYLVGILLVDIRDLLAFLVCHGDRGITRAFELGARSGALAAKGHESKEPQLVTLVLP